MEKLTSDVLVLRNDFNQHLMSSFRQLRDEPDFTDVTLAGDDGQMMEAHKVILAASSPLFQSLLKGPKQLISQLIYLRGVKSADLSVLLDYVYLGEVILPEERLQSFLLLANDLQLRGLEIKTNECSTENKNSSISNNGTSEGTKGLDKVQALEKKPSPPQHQNIDEEAKSLVEIGDTPAPGRSQGRVRICKVCGKKGVTIAITGHVKAKHLNSASLLPCQECGKLLKSSSEFLQHIKQCARETKNM